MTRRPGRWALVIAVGITIITNVPLFLVGALAVDIAQDVDVPPWALGLASAAYWAFAALTSSLVGSIARFVNARTLTIATMALAVVSLAGLAFYLPTWQAMVLWTALAGVTNGVGHPASNALLGASVAQSRLGFAFGVKQAAVPLSGLLAGLSLPIIAITFGWHPVFAIAAGGGVAVLVMYLVVSRGASGPLRAGSAPKVRIQPPLRRFLLLVACATCLTGGCATALTAFLTTGAVDRGIEPGLAGVVLALGTAASATGRLVAGVFAAKPGRDAIRTMSIMALCGGLGVLLMMTSNPGFYIGGFLVATGIGWAWPGLVHYSVSRIAGAATLSATGIVQTGTYIGSTVSPIVVGLIIDSPTAAPLAWLVLGCMSLGGAVFFWIARRVDPTRPARTTEVPA